jgi:hypothetical protein
MGGAFDLTYHEILASLGHAFEGVRDRVEDQQPDNFFRAGTYRTAQFPNPTRMDWPGLTDNFNI